MDRRTFLAAVATATPLVAGCTGGGGSADGSGGTTQSSGTTVTMVNTTYQPVRLEADAGATVEWVNEDGFGHTVTSTQFHESAASWDFDEQVAGGESVTHTFGEEGVYEYYCTIHGESTMCGVVLVSGATLDGTLPCEDSGGGGGGGGGGAY